MKHIVYTSDRPGFKLWIEGDLPNGRVLTGIGFRATCISPPTLVVDHDTWVHALPDCTVEATEQVIEVCAGLGGFSKEAARAGLTVLCGVDMNKAWGPLFAAFHSGAPLVVGDLGEVSVASTLASKGGFFATMLAGVACQPHSQLGDRKGMADDRSASLPRALSLAWTLQCTIVVLECVPEIQGDVEVQQLLRQFALTTGYRISQQVISLQNGWCTRRARWFCVLTAPLLGLCELQDFPVNDQFRRVRDVMPGIRNWPDTDHAQIDLNLYELSKFYAYAAGGIDSLFLCPDEACPTLLHSAGNQLYACACGCRGPLSEQRLKARGLFGVLIPLETTQVHMNQVMQHCRYLHPQEMWALMGGIPGEDVGHNLRLAMAGIGQAVSPMIGLWVLCQIKRHMDVFYGNSPVCAPEQVLKGYMHELVQTCRRWWPEPIPPTVPVTAEPEDPIEEVLPPLSVRIRWLTENTTPIEIACAAGTTGQQLLEAEQILTGTAAELVLWSSAQPLDLTSPLVHDAEIGIAPKGFAVGPVSEPTVPCCLSPMDVLAHCHEEPGRDWTVYAVSSFTQLATRRNSQMPKIEREAILSLQGPVWGDDELLAGLHDIASQTDRDQFVQVWDPLLITGLTLSSDGPTWNQLCAALGSVATVITATMIDSHWYPLVWRMDHDVVMLFTCGVVPAHVATFEGLATSVGDRRGVAGLWNNKLVPFVQGGHCGALVLLFTRHLLWGDAFPGSMLQVEEQACDLRRAFVAGLGESCLRPQLAALGLSVVDQLAAVLSEHGVDSSEARAKDVIHHLGEEAVGAAMQVTNVWRELKWLANQQRPPLVLIKPSELQRSIERRGGTYQVGNKRQKKTKGQGKGRSMQHRLDPSLLRLEHGLFQDSQGQALSQIALAGIGPQVSGVVLLSQVMAEPYLKANNCMSAGALGLFVVDSTVPVTTTLEVTSVRLPLLCTANAEPLLVDGLLYQLGAQRVTRAPPKGGCEIQAVATCVVKAMVYRDLTDDSWSQVCAHPMKHIFSKVSPLQQCEDDECPGCEAWHQTLQCPVQSPVLEAWGKQWMKLNFQYCPSDQAEIFGVHLRLPEVLQQQVQAFSGFAGVFLEPRSLDGKKPSDQFQVIWMPKSDVTQLMMLRQSLSAVCGLARMGNKLGLRCRVGDAAQVYAKVKPGQIYLPSGSKSSYLVGPFPFGTLKASVAHALATCGWVARPVQPVGTHDHVQGLMFRVHAVDVPPSKVLQMQHGDVVVTQESAPPSSLPVVPKVLASAATVAMVTKESEVDQLQINDPWAASKVAKPGPVPVQIGNPIEDMEQRVVAAVLAQMPSKNMEVDPDSDQQDYVVKLEQQMQGLQQHTQQLGLTMQQQHTEHTKQIQEVHHQMQQQHQHFDAAIQAQAGQIQGFQDSFQEQFRQQVVHQQSMLDSMFQKQMTQFESLLSKRARQE